jgi:hypothetical protein
MKTFIEILQAVGGFITILTPILLALIYKKQASMHKEINGRMSELIRTTESDSFQKGETANQGKTDAKDQKDK